MPGLVAPTYSSCETLRSGGTVCTTAEPDLDSSRTEIPNTMSAEFRYFVLRTLLSARDRVGMAVEFGIGLFYADWLSFADL